MSVIFECRDFRGRLIRLGLGSWRHILAKRPWFHEHQSKIRKTIEEPDLVLEGEFGELLAIKWFKELLGGTYLVVAYKPLNREGFIITAYPTKKVERIEKRRRVIWRKP